MPPSSSTPVSLPDLAHRLLADGPVKTLPTSRRVRILFGGIWVADTTSALYVWEHEYYPYFYLPLSSFEGDVLLLPEGKQKETGGDGEKRFAQARLRGGPKSTDRILVFKEPGNTSRAVTGVDDKARLSGMVRVEFSSVDAWYEEDTRIYVHPKDPFKRVDIVHSTRPVVVSVRVDVGGGEMKDVEVARATSSFHLYETGLPTRFYLPPTAVDQALLTDSETTTKCPYKGEANYYNICVPGGGTGGEKSSVVVLKDLVWYYRNPTTECVAISGALCFYNEKVDIQLDGKKLERPKTPFS